MLSKSVGWIGPFEPRATTTTAGSLPDARMVATMPSPVDHWRLTAALMAIPLEFSVLGA